MENDTSLDCSTPPFWNVNFHSIFIFSSLMACLSQPSLVTTQCLLTRILITFRADFSALAKIILSLLRLRMRYPPYSSVEEFSMQYKQNNTQYNTQCSIVLFNSCIFIYLSLLTWIFFLPHWHLCCIFWTELSPFYWLDLRKKYKNSGF